MLYEMFELVGEGNGDYGTKWKRVAWTRGTRAVAALVANRIRTEKPSGTFKMFCGAEDGIGRPLWDFPPLNA